MDWVFWVLHETSFTFCHSKTWPLYKPNKISQILPFQGQGIYSKNSWKIPVIIDENIAYVNLAPMRWVVLCILLIFSTSCAVFAPRDTKKDEKSKLHVKLGTAHYSNQKYHLSLIHI